MLLRVEVVSVCATDVRCAYGFTESLAVYLNGSIDDESVALFVLMACTRPVYEREAAAAATIESSRSRAPTLSMLFSQLIRRGGEGAVFADNRSLAFEQEHVREGELRSLIRSMLNWVISFLSEFGQGVIYAWCRYCLEHRVDGLLDGFPDQLA